MVAVDAAGDGPQGRVSPAQRLLRQVDRWLLELTLGMTEGGVVLVPAAASLTGALATGTWL
eukprot:gene5962-6201_t